MLFRMTENYSEFLKYGKARGTYLLNEFFPKLSGINEAYIIETPEDLYEIYNLLPEMVILRADSEIGKTPTPIRGCACKKEQIMQYINDVKKQNTNDIVLCVDNEYEKKRLRIMGSFNIEFEWGRQVIIEFVGEGFDVGVITKGEEIHESYTIPWADLLFVKDLDEYNKYMIKQKQYEESANRRIQFLMEKQRKSEEEAKNQVPEKYNRIPKTIHEKIFEEIIIPMLNYFMDNGNIIGVNEFGIQGLIHENEILHPVEIRTSQRHVTQDFYQNNIARKSPYSKRIPLQNN